MNKSIFKILKFSVCWLVEIAVIGAFVSFNMPFTYMLLSIALACMTIHSKV